MFYYTGGKFGEVAGDRTLSLRIRCAVVLGSVRVLHPTLSTGRRVTPVHASGAACLLWVSLTEII